MWTPPPAYRSHASTPTGLGPRTETGPSPRRLSTSTSLTSHTGTSGSSSRHSTQSCDFSVTSLGTSPSVLTSEPSPNSVKGGRDRDRIVGGLSRADEIREEDEDDEDELERRRRPPPSPVDELSDNSPIDPRQVERVSPTTAAIHSYIYFSPLQPRTPPPVRTRPTIPPRTLSNHSTNPSALSLYAYPIDYGESPWDHQSDARDHGGTATPRSAKTFRTVATDGSDHDDDLDIVVTVPSRHRPPRITTIGPPPLKSCLKPTQRNPPPPPILPTSPVVLFEPHKPFRPTSPLVMSDPTVNPFSNRPRLYPRPTPTQSSSSPTGKSPHPVAPAAPLAHSFTRSSPPNRTSNSSQTTLDPSPSATTTVTSSSSSSSSSTSPRRAPEKIWSARTNRYIYVHTTSRPAPAPVPVPVPTPSPPRAPSGCASPHHESGFGSSILRDDDKLGQTREEEEEEEEEEEVLNLPYVTRAPVTTR